MDKGPEVGPYPLSWRNSVETSVPIGKSKVRRGGEEGQGYVRQSL